MVLMIRLIHAGDHKLMRRLNQWNAPGWFRIWMLVATRAGDGWLWIAVGILLAWLGGQEGLLADASGLGAVIVGLILFLIVKNLTGRERPCATEEHYWAKLLPPDRFSFPSGHTITAFCAITPASLYFPALFPPLLFCALSVAVSRVVLGLHYLSDVIAGVLIGAGIGYAAFVLGGGVL